MDLIRFAAMSRYWDRHPPLHLMVQSYLGIKPVIRNTTQAKPEAANTDDDLQEFVQLFTAAGGTLS
ncbi:hypothetical protein [Ferriphaselus sp. R-1]|nr:hypothetical protein [Ferriphaselus sp. R-1]